MRLFLFLIPLVTLVGCTQFPALDNVVDPAIQSTEYPTLVPLEPLLAAQHSTAITPQTQTVLEARAARLKARAARLRAGANPANS